MSFNKTLLALALGACAATPVMAQDSLVDVYQLALQNDPAIREAQATYLATAETKPQALSELLPNLSFNGNRRHNFSDAEGGAVDPVTGALIGTRQLSEINQQSWSVSLQQVLFDWTAYATLRQADKTVLRAETDYLAAQQDLLIRVATAYFAVLTAEDNLASAGATREARSRQLEQAQRRYEVGLIAITDVQQSQAGYDDAVASEIEQQRLLSNAQEQLRTIVGELVMDLASPTDDLPLLTPDPASAEEWVNVALESNLALRSSRIAADIASDDIDIRRATRLPTLNLTAQYSDDDQERITTVFRPDPDTRSITQLPQGRSWQLQLTFPLYTGGRNRSLIQQSVYRHRASLEALERATRQTERQARDAYLGVITGISRVGALRQAVESNRTALRATEAGFEVGTQTTVDVLQAQDNLQLAETSYARSRYDYILNLLALKQAAGTLSEADLMQVDSWLQ